MNKLGLGTVQFGQPYGVSNTVGPVAFDEARAILSRAANGAIGVLDTAALYGEAEDVLGRLDTQCFRIVTKTRDLRNDVEAVIARARQSARTLGHVEMLLVHWAGDLAGAQGEDLWAALQQLKDQGIVGGIGISAYAADDPVTLALKFRPDAMQLPFSLLDQRLLQNGTLTKLHELGIEIHARSVFLQGLLFLDRLPEQLAYAAPHLASIKARIAAVGATPLAVALGFVLSRPEIAVALVGVTTVAELDEILAAANEPLPALDWPSLALDDERVLTPSQW